MKVVRATPVVLVMMLAAFVVGCSTQVAPSSPTVVPTQPGNVARNPQSVSPTAEPQLQTESAPRTPRVVMAVAPPGKEGSELRHTSAPDSWQLRPLYEFLIGVDPQTGKLIPQLATEWNLEP